MMAITSQGIVSGLRVLSKEQIKGMEGAKMTADEAITIFVQASPVKSHPSTKIIAETIASARYHLPRARMILCCDGVRKEQEAYKDRYAQFVASMAAYAALQVGGYEFYLAEKHLHQVACLRRILPSVTTPLIMYLEGDCPLVVDREIDFGGIVDALLDDSVGCVRFLPESRVCKFHLYLYEEQFESHGVPLWKTKQWSQRPHVATVELYKRALSLFSPEANTMVEDRLMTYVQHEPWESWRVTTYNPPDSMMRSCHLDARGTDSKFDDLMVF